MSNHDIATVKKFHQRSSSTGSHRLMFGNSGLGPPPISSFHHHSSIHQSSGSDDDEEASETADAPEITGTLSKWTNYIHGWQDRYFVLREGSLLYFKSEFDIDFGCRGAISIDKGTVRAHELDELRFEVSVSDSVWYLRAKSVEDRQRWIDTLEAHKKFMELNGIVADTSQAGTSHHQLNMRRHDSALSLASNASKVSHRELKEKLSELETFRDLLCRQVDKLQTYFDGRANHSKTHRESNHTVSDAELDVIDYKGEAITFKATTAGIVATLSHCIELMTQREETLQKKLDREQSARKRIEEQYKNLVEETKSKESCETSKEMAKMVAMSGPDFEEGPNSQIGEDEFYDAVESALDKLDEEQEYRDKLKIMSTTRMALNVSEATQHPLWQTIDNVTQEQLHYARLEVGQDSVWELFAEDGEMRMYKREQEIDGMVVDPLKAMHQVGGVTARELCHYFFSPEYRMEWETTVEEATVLEKIAPDTMIFLQLHKRVWPAAQRDALFWSHMRQIDSQKLDPRFVDTWIVCNQSTKHPDAPENQGGCLRVGLTVCFVCDTIVEGAASKETASRDQLKTKITYCSVVNPGGWAPASALRVIYKREYPKFLKRFTQYVIDKTKSKPIMW